MPDEGTMMEIEKIVDLIIKAAIGFVVPAILSKFIPDKPPTAGAGPVSPLPWFRWSVAGFIGGGLAGVVGGAANLDFRNWDIIAASIGFTQWDASRAHMFADWAIFGAAIGTMQWIALRGYASVGLRFIFSSVIGWMLCGVGGAIVAGVAIGLLQSMNLTKRSSAVLWVLINTIAWPVAVAAGGVVATTLKGFDTPLAWFITGGTVGLVGAIILLAALPLLVEKKRLQPA